MTSAIERDFPIEHINRLAKVESYRKNIYRPVYHMHKWWAKRLGSVFRATVLGSLLPEDSDVWGQYYIGCDFTGKVVLDPFMGSGTTLGEALRLGAKVIGQDINPVAWFQVRKAFEDVALVDLDRAFEYLASHVAPKITRFYKTQCGKCGSNEADVMYTFWVKELPCPACGTVTPLFPTRVFSKAVYAAKDPRGHSSCPKCGEVNALPDVRHKIAQCGSCHHMYNPHEGTATQSSFKCQNPVCGKTHRIIDVVRKLEKVPTHRMYALDYRCDRCGYRDYKAPSEADLRLYEEASRLLVEEEHLVPDVAIEDGYNTRQILNFNYRLWRDCFNPRQLYCLSTLLHGILDLPPHVATDNVKELFVLLFSATLEFNNMFTSFKGRGTGAVRHMFSHHVLAPEKVPLENNLWGTPDSSGAFSTLFYSKLRKGKEWCQYPSERLINDEGEKSVVYPPLDKPLRARFARTWDDLVNTDANALVRCASSTRLEGIPDGSVDAVITDPPYFDNVNYSELADFFYAWLRLALKGRYPEFEEPTTRRAEEAIVNSAQGKDAAFYSDVMTRVFKEAHRVLKDDGVLVFTFHHADERAWVSVAEAIIDAGFKCVAAWPVQGEMSVGVPLLGKNSIEHDIMLVCKKVTPNDVTTSEAEWEEVLRTILDESTALFDRLVSSNPDAPAGDLVVIAEGVCLKHYSQLRTAIRKSGQPLDAATAVGDVARAVLDRLVKAKARAEANANTNANAKAEVAALPSASAD
ncbi:putative DNA methylase [Symbiobacterium terraclitae]|uniref:DNA methylase n=1 Tax=Symbiobacterium terraclitae TaxID=557451 RepID=A0ABS4JQB8_9FIRM|nr:DNA methyltransferase [Symbiobacterium terraclitae]MBP2017733.1 putative DNA methylase [Symbiobacterium terraclitae]